MTVEFSFQQIIVAINDAVAAWRVEVYIREWPQSVGLSCLTPGQFAALASANTAGRFMRVNP